MKLYVYTLYFYNRTWYSVGTDDYFFKSKDNTEQRPTGYNDRDLSIQNFFNIDYETIFDISDYNEWITNKELIFECNRESFLVVMNEFKRYLLNNKPELLL